MKREEIISLVQKLLEEQHADGKRRELERRKESGAFIQDVHESRIGISSKAFKITSQKEEANGDLVIEWKTVMYLDTEFTVDKPYEFEKEGILVVHRDGTAELK
ncbi:MAG: hypothetical protein ACFE7R_09810 [Candidatus Hodarchaeota archaeon]